MQNVPFGGASSIMWRHLVQTTVGVESAGGASSVIWRHPVQTTLPDQVAA
jgi:hypothetical protein